MLGTRRRGFGNVIGHVNGVEDIASVSAWTSQQFDPTLNWNDVEWIKRRWGGKLILKGVMDAEDARLAANTGADAIVVGLFCVGQCAHQGFHNFFDVVLQGLAAPKVHQAN